MPSPLIVTPNGFETLVLSNGMTGAILAALLGLVAWHGRAVVRDMCSVESPFWRFVLAGWTGLIAGTIAWISVSDNWLHLVLEPYRSFQPWASKRVIYNPVDGNLRIVSLVLIVCLAVLSAMLFGRFVGSFALQLLTLVGSVVLWLPVFLFHQRLSVLVVDGAGTSATWPEVSGVLAFWTIREALSLATIALTFAIIAMLVTPLVTLLLSAFRMRQDTITDEADAYFGEVSNLAEHTGEVSLHSRWRPIQRPL